MQRTVTGVLTVRGALGARSKSCRALHYIQGQSPEPNVREYFYYIDHQGMLFLDDAKMKNFTSCFKEKKFLEFFFKRIRINRTGKYEHEFPYLSLCGRERNYIRCDDLPIVFTHIIKSGDNKHLLSYGYAGELLTVPFAPQDLCMPESGRIYHPAMDYVGGVGLIRSALAIEISKCFHFESNDNEAMPTHFTWEANTYELTNKLLPVLKKIRSKP
ncbi:UPF0598 protein CG30010-like protein [Dinothrombium tinctorium]|uniref:UPF0598 protein CG30010-like protein n=1 Tax=Dinothrombium tinctorium TaxID=1965070 RepID=A0A3S3P7P1_9ACAR|nr:UPF0598 protein CG30010-like protein [Dinothrombium tinctorium]RWS16691.1 UPF0598 protein CG30010-like protein [Dinothrombium tinctorium]